ncbi:hypothetical protein OWR29_26005 [Actinoplanes sp. Pm04-4]|uniref:Uncharacterized protein n=1 Tax=Paractinoplanes pyxinae TaxID=2997416 RepID=A0ABT4B793_9ACTN|nr:hypothetical protein [Actinoplanes pyxinae]MCY1141465.1 hypothetical protein [Actinoplanes pyxinae]
MKYAVPLLGIVGVLLFGVLRLAYVFFYMRMHVTPEEVGYGYSEILSSQLTGTAELALLLTGALVLAAYAARAVRQVVAGRWRAAASMPVRAERARLVQRCGITAVVVVLVCLPMLAWTFGTEAQHGYAVRHIYLPKIRIPVLGVHASPAKVAWIKPPERGAPGLSTRRCLMFLGQAAGLAVFYDVTTGENLRVPTAQILVTIPDDKHVPDDC